MAVQNLNQIWFIKGKRGGQSEEELFFSPVYLILKCIFQYWESIFPGIKTLDKMVNCHQTPLQGIILTPIVTGTGEVLTQFQLEYSPK